MAQAVVFDKLKEERRKNKVSQKDMAGYLGINEATMGRYENGGRDIPSRKLELYASRLGFTLYIIK